MASSSAPDTAAASPRHDVRWPNVIVPGAGKSGTTFLASLLGQLPSFHLPSTKEPALFSDHARYGQWQSGDRYLRQWLADYDGERYLVDASTIYLWDDPVAARIAEHAPGASLIFCLRDPVDRLYSNYWQDIKAGVDHPSFDRFVGRRCDRFQNMLKASSYHLDLPRFEALFPAEQLTYVSYAELTGEPIETTAAIASRVTGVPWADSELTGLLRTGPKNGAAAPRSRVLARAMRNPDATDAIRRLVPTRFSTQAKHALHRLRSLNQVAIDYEPIGDELGARLAEELQPAVDAMTLRCSTPIRSQPLS